MTTILANPTVIVNNNTAPIVPNTFSYTEGFGEQEVRVQSSGGGSVEAVSSDNVETHLSTMKFAMLPTAENIEVIRSWKVNKNKNAITPVGVGVTRSMSNATLISDYEVNLSSDGVIDLEFKGNGVV